MLRFAANLAMLYPEVPLIDRIYLAARDGFAAVEFFFPYQYPPAALRARLDGCGVQLVLFNATPRKFPDDRGVACLPGREDEFRDTFLRALHYAHELDCSQLHVMAGRRPEGVAHERLRDVFVGNLQWAAEKAAQDGRILLIEPINTRDMPGFFLNRQEDAHAIVLDVGAANVQVQMDLFHCQIVQGDVARNLARYLPTGRVGHIQIAGVPDRHEPDTGELDYGYLLPLIDELGFDGWIGCEYQPLRGAVEGGTTQGLAWLRALGGLPRRS